MDLEMVSIMFGCGFPKSIHNHGKLFKDADKIFTFTVHEVQNNVKQESIEVLSLIIWSLYDTIKSHLLTKNLDYFPESIRCPVHIHYEQGGLLW
jgi:hypothetical protein